MAKFKVGDKVRFVRCVTGSMTKTKWVGKEFVIKSIQSAGEHGTRYGVGEFLVVHENEIVSANAPSIHITTDGTTTHAVLKEGKRVIKRAEAKYSPSDTFDFATGAKLVFERLVGEDKPAEPEKSAFVPHLEFAENGVFAGKIGTPTPYLDAVGQKLEVGDTVEFFHDGVSEGVRTVALVDFTKAIPSEAKPELLRKLPASSRKIFKKRSHSEIPHGESVGTIRYIKEPKQ